MKIKKIFKNKEYIIIVVLSLYILHLNNFFFNFYTIASHSLEKRLTQSYGYCGGPSYGFIKDIYKKYDLKENISIYDGEYPSFVKNEWFFFQPNLKTNKKKIILVNNNNNLTKNNGNYNLLYKGQKYQNLELLENFSNCYFFEMYD